MWLTTRVGTRLGKELETYRKEVGIAKEAIGESSLSSCEGGWARGRDLGR
jgi:hypothetical protein